MLEPSRPGKVVRVGSVSIASALALLVSVSARATDAPLQCPREPAPEGWIYMYPTVLVDGVASLVLAGFGVALIVHSHGSSRRELPADPAARERTIRRITAGSTLGILLMLGCAFAWLIFSVMVMVDNCRTCLADSPQIGVAGAWAFVLATGGLLWLGSAALNRLVRSPAGRHVAKICLIPLCFVLWAVSVEASDDAYKAVYCDTARSAGSSAPRSKALNR